MGFPSLCVRVECLLSLKNIDGHYNSYCNCCLEKQHLTLQSKNVDSRDVPDAIIPFNIIRDQGK